MAALARSVDARGERIVIRRLRIRHRRTFGVLAVLLPIGFVAAIAARPEFPASATSPRELYQRADGQLFIQPGLFVDAPDVLVYLVPGEFSGDSLPADALLLGSLASAESRFKVPADFEEGGHTLVYYSLGHGEIVLTSGI